MHGPLCKKHGVVKTPRSKKCPKCNVEQVKRRRQKIKLDLVNLYGGKCIKCEYNKCLGALTFHHRDRSTKDFKISMRLGWQLLVEETQKCDLLCANCHAEEHDRLEEEKLSTCSSKEEQAPDERSTTGQYRAGPPI